MPFHEEFYETKKASQVASDAFQADLEKKHGRNAGDVRYHRDQQDAETQALGDTYRAASEAHHAEWLKTLPSYVQKEPA